jgi:hypothetical protein
MSNRSDREIRSLNFIANCSQADFSNLKLALLAKPSIVDKDPQFMFSFSKQQVIITSKSHQFRDTEFANISLSGTLISFQPIFGKKELSVPNFSSFKAVAAAGIGPLYRMSNRTDREIRSLNFIANCSEADFPDIKLALLAKLTIVKKDPQFMFSVSEQRMIITNKKYQFRNTEFANICVSGAPVSFQPIFGKMEQNVPNFSSFKAVAESAGASGADCEHDAESAGAAVTSAGPGMSIFCDCVCAWPCGFCCFSIDMLDMLLAAKFFFCMPLPMLIYIPPDLCQLARQV